MIVRYKLDACGIKLKLSEWSRMTPQEREHFAVAECTTPQQVAQYYKSLRKLIEDRTGNSPSEIAVEENPAWSRTDQIPPSVLQKLAEGHGSISVQQWRELTDLQRFVLVKLSYPAMRTRIFQRPWPSSASLPTQSGSRDKHRHVRGREVKIAGK